ncbi:unnamed protein product [Echinostoma caproni]|uniref:HA2 domain-containing protein n=1 Tax=Echinostoma caproni TaxID=27848 RepID=A0A183AFA9_9TREM|nr:unnamed protein product [Echinostoma caproni]
MDVGLTALMVCAAAGLVDSVDRLLGFGADVFLRVPIPYEVLQARNRGLKDADFKLMGPKHRRIQFGDENYMVVGMNAYDLARSFGHRQVASILSKHMAAHSLRHVPENWEAVLYRFGAWFDSAICSSPFNQCNTVDKHDGVTSTPDADNDTLTGEMNLNPSDPGTGLITTYLVARNGLHPETVVDFDLLVILLTTDQIGYVCTRSKHIVLILHSRMLVADLTRVYAKPPDGYRKIILSSNITESCMSFDDVRYIIDCGLDCTSEGRLAHALALIHRAHEVLEQLVDDELSKFAEFVPGQSEACIQARLLAPANVSIQTVLDAVPRPPESAACCDSILSLMEMDALDTFQDLTELGYHICDIPIPPRYAKMVLVSVALKCLDPILTIACILTYAEPFVIPKNATERREMLNARKKFSADTLSDHMMLLRAFQFWQKARSEGWEKSFCQKNFISTAAFEIITVIRTQLLGQLRASGFVKARGSGDIRDLNTNSENWAVVKAAIVAGMHANFVRIDRDKNKLCSTKASLNLTVQLHPQSVLATNADGTPVNFSILPCEWLVYDEMLQHDEFSTDLGLVRCVTVVSPITIALMAGPMKLRPDLLRLTENAIHAPNPLFVDWSLSNSKQNQMMRPPSEIPGSSVNLFSAPRIECPSPDPNESHSDSDSEEIWSALTGKTSGNPTSCHDFPNPIDSNPVTTSTTVPMDLLDFRTCLAAVRSSRSTNGLLSVMNIRPTNSKGHNSLSGVTSLDAPQAGVTTDSTLVPLRFDDNELLHFQADAVAAQLILALRQKWQALLLRRLRNPGKQCSQQDESILSVLVTVLTSEEQVLGLRQPSGVGARPRPMAAELCNQYENIVKTPTPLTETKSVRSPDDLPSVTSAQSMTNQSFVSATTITSLPCSYPYTSSPPLVQPNPMGAQSNSSVFIGNTTHQLVSTNIQPVEQMPVFSPVQECSDVQKSDSAVSERLGAHLQNPVYSSATSNAAFGAVSQVLSTPPAKSTCLPDDSKIPAPKPEMECIEVPPCADGAQSVYYCWSAQNALRRDHVISMFLVLLRNSFVRYHL